MQQTAQTQVRDYVASKITQRLEKLGASAHQEIRKSIHVQKHNFAFATKSSLIAAERHTETTPIPPTVVDDVIRGMVEAKELRIVKITRGYLADIVVVALPTATTKQIHDAAWMVEQGESVSNVINNPYMKQLRHLNWKTYFKTAFEEPISLDKMHPYLVRRLKTEKRLEKKRSEWTEFVMASPVPLTDPEELHASEQEDAYLAEGKTVDITEILTIESLTPYAAEVRAPVPQPEDTSFDGELQLTALTRLEATTPEQARANAKEAKRRYIHAFLQTKEGQAWAEREQEKANIQMEVALKQQDEAVAEYDGPEDDDDVFSVAVAPVERGVKSLRKEYLQLSTSSQQIAEVALANLAQLAA